MKRLQKLLSAFTAMAMLLPSTVQPVSADNATKSYEVYDLPTMYLNAGITSTQVSSITIAAPTRNGVTITIPAMSGAIFHVTQNAKEENIYASRLAVDQTTSIVTLTGITRDLCYNQTRTFTGCTTAQGFSKGAQAVLTNDARLLNLKANIDRANTFSASGAIAFVGSGSFAMPTFATTAARDQALGSNPSGPSRWACVNATTSCYMYIGGSWTTVGSSTTVSASESVAGKVQLGTVKDQSGSTVNGSTGAPTVVQTKNLTGSGGVPFRGYVPFLNQIGALDAKVGGTGLAAPTQSGVLVSNGKNAMNLIQPGASNNVLISNGTSWTSGLNPGGSTIFASGSYATKLLSNGGTEQNFDRTYTFGTNSLTAGSVYMVWVAGSGGVISTNPYGLYRLKLGTTPLCQGFTTGLGSTSRYGWLITGFLNVISTGGSGKMNANCTVNAQNTSGSSGSTLTVDTTSTNTLQVGFNANGSASTSFSYLTDFFLMKIR